MVTLPQKRMLPRNLPKLGSFLVNPTAKFGGIERDIQVHEPRFGLQRNVLAFENTLVRGLGEIIPLEGLVANVFFSNQLEGGLEEVDVEAQIVINAFQEKQFFLRFPAVIANGVADD